MTREFPLVTLHPVSDLRNAWVALMLGTAPADDAAVARLFAEFELGDALGPLPCIVTPADPAAVDAALPATRVVLRLPVDYCCDPAHDEDLHALRARGFRLLAEGMPTPGRHLSDAIPALALDCPGAYAPAAIAAWLSRLPGPHLALSIAAGGCPPNCHFQWLAAGVHGKEQHGDHGRAIDAPSRLLLLELLSKVANDADSHEIEATIKRDPQLSYYLLKLVNSVGFALTSKITSFNQAITLLGRRQLQRWLQLLLYARTRDGDKANALLPRAAMRAGLAEALCNAGCASRDMHDRAFMAGMFSLLDQLFGMPIEEIVGPLNLADDVQAALTSRGGPLGAILRAVEAGEDPHAQESLPGLLRDVGIGAETWARCLVSACKWAVLVSSEA
ncbi:MAG TPA: HDOD domain-containing protein [Rhodocyclaceae bacterium]